MWYVYERESTLIFKQCKTLAAAKAHITRMHKRYTQTNLYVPGSNAHEDDPLNLFGIAEQQYFHMIIERRMTRRNLITGQEFTQPVNTPLSCDPSTETYWSM